tara:strand:+ start:66 stop:347 length:282 start_codon:yes stop_codon:yes gene_type:complete
MEDSNIINLEDYRREKEEEEADAIEAERHYLGLTLKSVLREMRAIEDRAEGLRYRNAMRQAQREIAEEDAENETLNESWFTRTFGFMKSDDDI